MAKTVWLAVPGADYEGSWPEPDDEARLGSAVFTSEAAARQWAQEKQVGLGSVTFDVFEQTLDPDAPTPADPGHVAVHMAPAEWRRVYERLMGRFTDREWGQPGPITQVIGEAAGILDPPADGQGQETE